MGQNFLAIDFETANYNGDSACSIGLVKVMNDRIVTQEVFLIRPPTQHFVFSYLHGISWETVAKAPTFGKLWPKIAHLFDGVEFLAAHNATFDKKVLFACCSRYKVTPPPHPFTCTMKLARNVFSIYPTKLSDVCRRLKIKLNHHEALSDATACAKIVLAAEESKQGRLMTIKKKVENRRPVENRAG